MSSDDGLFLKTYPDVAAAIDLLEHWLAQYVENNRLPGLSIGIVYDQTLVWAKGFGYADLKSQTPATSLTLYRIASHTKMFTATAIMQLRDAGKLGLDDPVRAYLPWFGIRYRDDQPGDRSDITIRQLLSHTSGLPRDATIPVWTDDIFPAWQAIMATTPEREAAYLTDQKRKYSNLAYTLAGAVVEAASGQDYATYIREHILDPLDMLHTRVLPEADTPGLATGYMRPDAQGLRPEAGYTDVQGFRAAASIASNVEDMARFVSFQFRDEPPEANPVLRGGTVREMHRPQWIDPDWATSYGLGLSLRRIDDWSIAGHSGGLKGYLTQTAWCRDQKFGVIALINALSSIPQEVVDRTFRMIAPRLLAAVKGPEPQADPEWQAYVGTYHNVWGDDQFVTIEANQVRIVALDWIGDPPTILAPIPGERHTFRAVEGGAAGERVVFEVDAHGQVTRMYVAGEYYDRV
ncbi:MAG: serine hydrolase [Anaerolineae bacterium]|nr:serine hydrolase [Anaerolineae bacterium]